MTVGDLYTDIDYIGRQSVQARGTSSSGKSSAVHIQPTSHLSFVGLSVTLVSALPFIDRTRTTYDIVTLV